MGLNTYGEMRSYIFYDAWLNTAARKMLDMDLLNTIIFHTNSVDDLILYEFFGICGFLSQDTTHKKQHTHYYLRNAVLAIRAAL